MIKIQALSKTYTYYRKEKGIKASIKNLFLRKNLEKHAVKNLSFEVKEGEIIGLIGPNGSGKTTTLKILSGILPASQGTVSVMGFDPWKRENAFKKNFSIIMGQKSQLWPDLPAIESLILNKHIYEISDQDFNTRLEELTELLNVKHVLNVQVRRLSLGERMKLELIACLLHRPKVLLLDEPTIGLDFESQLKIRDFLKKYNELNKTTIILTSHYMKDLEDLTKRAVVINNGELIYDGLLNDIRKVMGNKKIIELHSSKKFDLSKLNQYGQVKSISDYAVKIEVEQTEVKGILPVLLSNCDIVDFNILDVPLEESIGNLYTKGGTHDLDKQIQ